MFLSKDTPLVAVDIGSYSVKLAQLNLKKNKPELLSFGLLPLEQECLVDGSIQKPDEVIEAIGRLLKAEKIESKFAVSSLASEAVITKRIKVPEMSREELEERINEEAEQYIPFDIDDVSLSFQILGPAEMDLPDEEGAEAEDQGPKMEILLVAVQREIIDNRIDVLSDAGLKPVIMDLDVFATVNAANLISSVDEFDSVALIDLGDSFTHLNILSNGVTAVTRDIPIGGGQCAQKLISKFDLPFKEATRVKLGALPSGIETEEVLDIIRRSFEKITAELVKTFEYYQNTQSLAIERIILCGGGAMIPGVDHLFMNQFKTPVEIMDPLSAIKYNPKNFEIETMRAVAPLTAVALGLATRRFDYK
ncbi:MAG: type IV pilus assembly protein PilM [Candidatus Nitrohelix vancouverensis]|uniref:Type IV pilus assembly protein PilM n=1 Tax=Candidatus Nitrohelix vancouverensis TaxID=2705534 RepID=A0A7T0C177_9BACT|nr:MAG: type IV pilus assembly protein PilM [Candidatus Nitrohelix vancouverensis]